MRVLQQLLPATVMNMNKAPSLKCIAHMFVFVSFILLFRACGHLQCERVCVFSGATAKSRQIYAFKYFNIA